MIYLDSSIALAWLFTEPRNAPDAIWSDTVTSSRLLEYEVWTRIHMRGLEHGADHHLAAKVRTLLARVAFLELEPTVLAGALKPFPIPVRTLDALHLATIEYIRSQGLTVELATFDRRMMAAARALGIAVYDL